MTVRWSLIAHGSQPNHSADCIIAGVHDVHEGEGTDVLIAGAGPIGLTAAIELTRRGVRCRVVDPLIEPPLYAKAVGVQPRTLEVFENMGVLRRILDAAVDFHGQIVYVNGVRVTEIALSLPDDVPFGFVCIPQYETETHPARRTRRAGCRGAARRRGWPDSTRTPTA